MEYKYTKHQVARGTLPDAETYDRILLIKYCTELRATYQVKLLTYFAYIKNKRLIIRIPKICKIHESLKNLKKENPKLIKIERV